MLVEMTAYIVKEDVEVTIAVVGAIGRTHMAMACT
jgi:hypothetical protein